MMPTENKRFVYIGFSTMRSNHDGMLNAHQIEQGSHGPGSITPRAKTIRRRAEKVISNTQGRVLIVQNAVSVTDDIAPLHIGHSLMLRQKKAIEVMRGPSIRCLLFHGRLCALVPSLDLDSNDCTPESVTEVIGSNTGLRVLTSVVQAVSG